MSPSPTGPERFALSSTGRCLYHCPRPTRPHALTHGRKTIGWVYSCPGGTVSTVAFFSGGRRPSPTHIQRYLQSRTERGERVQPRDLRAATRRGPELGKTAERWIARSANGAPIRLLYWRRYPRKVGRGYSFLYACYEHGAGEVRFYTASKSSRRPECPFCLRAKRGVRASPEDGRGSRRNGPVGH
jgi:hypothetical protein